MTADTDREDAIEPATQVGGALGALLEDVRPSRPRIDWERVEAKLFDAHGNVRESAMVGSPRRSLAGPVAALLAMAAAFAVALTSPSRTAAPPAPKVAVVRAPIVQAGGGTLHVGDSIVAPAGGLVIESAGRLTARVTAGTKIKLLDDGERIHLALDEGAIAAEIVPVPGGEPFAIDAGGRRVAVHGTKLRVAVVSGQIEVAVSEGSAVVGFPQGAGRTEGPLVPAGSIGQFTPSGTLALATNPPLARDIVDAALAQKPVITAMKPTGPALKDHPFQSEHPGESPIAKKPGVFAPIAPTTTSSVKEPVAEPEVIPPPPAKGLSDAQIDKVLPRITAGLSTCWNKAFPAAPKSSFTWTMTLEVSTAGGVLSANTTDLPDKVRDCARNNVIFVPSLFAEAEGKTVFTRTVTVNYGDK